MLQADRPLLGELDRSANVPADLRPPLPRDEVGLGIGEPAAVLQPDVAGPQRPPEFPEGAQLEVAAVDLTLPVDHVGTPAGRDELDRGLLRQPALPAGVEVPEEGDGLEDGGAGPVGAERQVGEELRRELAEVAVAVGQEVELMIVGGAGQPFGPLHRRAEGLRSHLAVDRRPQLPVGDARVEDDATDLAEEPDDLIGRPSGREPELLELPLGPGRSPGQAAVEQVDDLVGRLLEGLTEEGDQDGIPPLGGGPLQA